MNPQNRLTFISSFLALETLVQAIDAQHHAGGEEAAAANAAAYAYSAAVDSGYEVNDLTVEHHLDYLYSKGCDFDRATAMEYAKVNYL